MTDPAAARCCDANGNRAAEGLRVLEDCARFLLDDASLSGRAKALRHRLRQALPGGLIAWRDTAGDVGTAIKADDEARRARLADLIRANARRVEEALRTIDEFAKLAGLAGGDCEAIRYACYDLERDLLRRLPGERLRSERLYVLVDAALCDDPPAVAAAAVAGGAGLVQLRAKALGVRPYADLARAVMAAVRAAGGLFVVNDHIDVAAAIGADGVHVGQDDLPVAEVRRVVGPLMLIGVSAHTPAQALAAQAAGADYVGLGPMHATATKAHEAERGPQLLDQLAGRLTIASYAIGGLDPARVAAIRDRLLHGIAVAGCVCRAEDPAALCRSLRKLLDG